MKTEEETNKIYTAQKQQQQQQQNVKRTKQKTLSLFYILNNIVETFDFFLSKTHTHTLNPKSRSLGFCVLFSLFLLKNKKKKKKEKKKLKQINK